MTSCERDQTVNWYDLSIPSGAVYASDDSRSSTLLEPPLCELGLVVGFAADSFVVTVECIPQLDYSVRLALADDTTFVPELKEVVCQSLHPVVPRDVPGPDAVVLHDMQ